MTEPIVIMVRRQKCPHCGRTWAHKATALKHMDRCWSNPGARGCKTCKHYEPAGGGGPDHGVYEWDPFHDEACAVGVTLVRPCDPTCKTVCNDCPGKPGPIVHCDLWEAADVRAT